MQAPIGHTITQDGRRLNIDFIDGKFIAEGEIISEGKVTFSEGVEQSQATQKVNSKVAEFSTQNFAEPRDQVSSDIWDTIFSHVMNSYVEEEKDKNEVVFYFDNTIGTTNRVTKHCLAIQSGVKNIVNCCDLSKEAKMTQEAHKFLKSYLSKHRFSFHKLYPTFDDRLIVAKKCGFFDFNIDELNQKNRSKLLEKTSESIGARLEGLYQKLAETSGRCIEDLQIVSKLISGGLYDCNDLHGTDSLKPLFSEFKSKFPNLNTFNLVRHSVDKKGTERSWLAESFESFESLENTLTAEQQKIDRNTIGLINAITLIETLRSLNIRTGVLEEIPGGGTCLSRQKESLASLEEAERDLLFSESSLTKLREIRITNCALTDKAFANLVTRSPELETITLIGCSQLSPAVFSMVPSKGLERKWNIERCPRLTEFLQDFEKVKQLLILSKKQDLPIQDDILKVIIQLFIATCRDAK